MSEKVSEDVQKCINPNLFYNWSKDFFEAEMKRLQVDTAREATSIEVGELRKENS